MLACIACAKHDPADGGEDGSGGARPSDKEAVKSLSSQIKDMVLKISSSARRSKGGGGSSSFSSTSFRSKSFRGDPRHRQQHRGAYTYEDAAHYAAAATSGSTATWDLMEEETQRRRGGGKWSGAAEQDVVLEDHDQDEPKEWVAQVEPGVHITFVSLPGGAGNDLKRIRFSREMFNKWQAQRWWGENYDRIMELYNVQRYNRQALQTPARSDDGERESSWSRVGSAKESPITTEQLLIRDTTGKPPSAAADGKGAQIPSLILPHRLHSPAAAAGAGASGVKAEAAATTNLADASRTTTSSRDEASVSASNASDLETTEWVEQDEPGVYITIRELADGTRELRRVRFSREKFGEVHAKLWWEANRERIQAQYL